jgi:uncharacterized protein YdhG (YjbR/CyaY superfamily)
MPIATIDEYIRQYPPAIRAILRKIRATVHAAAPRAEETISYRIPAFRQEGMLVYFAAFKNHIGLFPPVRGNASLERAVAKYAGPKKNLRFPYDQPIPYTLIRRIVKHQVKHNHAKALAGKKK